MSKEKPEGNCHKCKMPWAFHMTYEETSEQVEYRKCAKCKYTGIHSDKQRVCVYCPVLIGSETKLSNTDVNVGGTGGGAGLNLATPYE